MLTDCERKLSRLEREVLHLGVEGRSISEAAAKLCKSRRTIGWHRRSIFTKFGVHSILAAVALYHQERLALDQERQVLERQEARISEMKETLV